MKSRDEQIARGREARRRLPRNAHGEWTPSAARDPLAVIRTTEQTRIPELVPIRRERMSASAFGFFRGAADVMAHDLAPRPSSGIDAQICGDAHVLNLGAFGSPEGKLVFDVNDFDESVRAPFEWDLLRFATSLVLAGREAGDSAANCDQAVCAFVHNYRKSMGAFSKLPFIALLSVDVRRIVSAKPVDRVLRKAERAAPASLVTKLIDGGKFRDNPPLLLRVDGTDVIASLGTYEESLWPERRVAFHRYEAVDVAFKVSGTGSVGLRDYVVRLRGEASGDVLFLQVKEEPGSCYAPFVPAEPQHQGRRTAEAQRLMQRTSDPLLGWTSIDGRDYLVRQLCDHKAGIEPKDLGGKALVQYARVAGSVFARDHARTGDAATIAAYCGSSGRLDHAISRFAAAYADQTVADHAAFRSI
ncbi:MAG TPA: DUF2252 domain-containing protein [Thermoanaerobaculia bacterium]|jgi:uncharacterized protein (DUF2252 family)|nr:DUF2252 domain-containing protein [Thermoanaerobaculia bacterium]